MKIKTAIIALKAMEEELEYQKDLLEETRSYLKDYEDKEDQEEHEYMITFHKSKKQHILDEIWEIERAIEDLEETEI